MESTNLLILSVKEKNMVACEACEKRERPYSESTYLHTGPLGLKLFYYVTKQSTTSLGETKLYVSQHDHN